MKTTASHSTNRVDESIIQNDVLQGIKNHTLGPQGSRVLIVDPGEYRASSSIGMAVALEEAGIRPEDFDHIIVNSSGAFAGIWFAQKRMSDILRYCEKNSPRNTLRFRDIRKRSILKVEKLLSGMLLGEEIRDEQEWYKRMVLPENQKKPVIHVVTTTTGSNPHPRYIRSDQVTPEQFQKALSATLTIPRWSEPIRYVWDEELIDGYFSDPVMYDYARTLGASYIVKLGNHNGPHLESESNEAFIAYWLDRLPFLAKFYAKKRPHDIHHQMQRMYTDEHNGKVKVLFAEPYPDAFESPLLTGRRAGFYENVLAGRQKMAEIIRRPHEGLPPLRPAAEKTLIEVLGDMLWDMPEAIDTLYRIGR